MRKQVEKLESMRRSKLRDERSFSTLKNEKIELQNLILELQTLQLGEDYWEERARWELLQERENSCATGKKEVCANFFNSSFYSIYELSESVFIPSRKARKTGARIKNVIPEQEIRELNNAVGIERVKKSLCLVEDLLPEEDMRIYANLFEYLDYMRTPGGQLLQNRREDIKFNEGLLSAYLDKGSKGFLHLNIMIFEIISLLLSPILLPIHGVFLAFDYVGTLTWLYIKSTAQDAKTISTPSTRSLWQKLCVTLSQTQEPDSSVAIFFSFFDYTQYSFLMNIQDSLYPLYGPPIWAYNIMIHAPYVYFDYYIRGKSSSLPQRRNSCLLRSGIETIRNELKVLAEKIETQEEMRRLQQEVREESGLGDLDGDAGSVDSDSSGSNKKRRKNLAQKNKNRNKKKSPEVRDLGPGGIWEVVKDSCLESTFGDYKYKFCYFGDIKQDKTLLGKFNRWGKKGLVDTTDIGGVDSAGGKKTHKFVNKREEQRAAAAISAAAAKKQSENPDEYYMAQVYEGGARCQVVKGLSRSVEVEFECSSEEAIHQVTEVETCTYHMRIRTPIACSAVLEEKAMSLLETLGVFGFSKMRTIIDAVAP